MQTGKWENCRPVPFILNKPICGRGWILFLDEAEYLPFVEVNGFRANGASRGAARREDFREMARKAAKLEQKSNLIK